MNYLIGSGYHYRSPWDSEFLKVWIENVNRYSCRYRIISTDLTMHPSFIGCDHNLGHVGCLIKEQRGGLCGWSGSVILLAMLAYNMGRDLIFKEGDCLWFGDVIGQLYKDCEGKEMVFGRKMETHPYMPCAQSTFLIKHGFLLKFVQRYLAFPDDRIMLPEEKFVALEELYPDKIGRMSFGVDRERPLPWDAPVWYAQQWTQEELDEAKRRGLI
jgi:hypothetical protein